MGAAAGLPKLSANMPFQLCLPAPFSDIGICLHAKSQHTGLDASCRLCRLEQVRNGVLCRLLDLPQVILTAETLGIDFMVPRRKLWVVQGMLVGSGSPDDTANCALAMRITVKSCACGAPLRGGGT